MQIIQKTKRWTDEEDNFIRDNYLRLSDSEIAQNLDGRTERAVSGERKKLGLLRQAKKKSGYKNGVRPTFDEVKKMFTDKDYTLLSGEDEYITQGSKLKYICKKHEDKGMQTIDVSHLKQGRGCWYCGRERTNASKKSPQSEIENDKYLCELKGFTYIKTESLDGKIYIFFICNKHKMLGVQKMTRGNMNRDSVTGCQYCNGKNLPPWYVKDVIESKYQNIEVLSEYDGMNKSLYCYCKTHDEYFTNIAKEIYHHGRGCCGCAHDHRVEKMMLSYDEIVERITGVNPDIIVVDADNYTSYDSKIHLRCRKCGEDFYYNLYDLRNNKYRCPYCEKDPRISYGESEIIKYLSAHDIKYIFQYAIDECRYKKPLPFDFGIIDEDMKLLGLVEFQGEQHYHPIEYFGGEKKFHTQVKRDKIKKDYCENKNIPLLIIPYWEYENINVLLDEFMKMIFYT